MLLGRCLYEVSCHNHCISQLLLMSSCAGMPLRDTLLDQFTLTEVLRLHIMSSGARANNRNARFRYQQRGGYSSLDDPGLELRKQDPALVKKLQIGNVFDFSPGKESFVGLSVLSLVETNSVL